MNSLNSLANIFNRRSLNDIGQADAPPPSVSTVSDLQTPLQDSFASAAAAQPASSRIHARYDAGRLTSNWDVHEVMYEELYDESLATLHLREKAFFNGWRDFLATRRPFWNGATAITFGSEASSLPAEEVARRRIAVQVRYDMAFDFPGDEEYPPRTARMREEWRFRHFGRILELEIASRIKRLHRNSAIGAAGTRVDRERKTRSMYTT